MKRINCVFTRQEIRVVMCCVGFFLLLILVQGKRTFEILFFKILFLVLIREPKSPSHLHNREVTSVIGLTIF